MEHAKGFRQSAHALIERREDRTRILGLGETAQRRAELQDRWRQLLDDSVRNLRDRMLHRRDEVVEIVDVGLEVGTRFLPGLTDAVDPGFPSASERRSGLGKLLLRVTELAPNRQRDSGEVVQDVLGETVEYVADAAERLERGDNESRQGFDAILGRYDRGSYILQGRGYPFGNGLEAFTLLRTVEQLSGVVSK